MYRFSWLPVFTLVVLLNACAGVGQHRDYSDLGVPAHREISTTPFFPQERYQCGPASLAAVLNHAGEQRLPEALVPYVFLPEREGSLQADMLAAPAHFELLGVRTQPALAALLELLAAGYPVVVLQNLGLTSAPVWHYAVVIGYSLPRREVYLRSGTDRRLSYGFRRFEATWVRADRWAMVVAAPGRIPPAVSATSYLQAVSVLERLGKYDAAARGYRAAGEHWADNALARAGAANVAYAQGDYRTAEMAYRQALARSPQSPLLMNNLAMTLAQRGCREAALAVIDCARRKAPDHPLLKETLEDIRTRRGGLSCQGLNCPFAPAAPGGVGGL